MITKVATTEIGIDRAMTAVLRTSLRKKKMTRIASSPPCQALLSTSLMAPSMNVDWSKMVASAIPDGSDFWIRSRRAFTARATPTVLASPSL